MFYNLLLLLLCKRVDDGGYIIIMAIYRRHRRIRVKSKVILLIDTVAQENITYKQSFVITSPIFLMLTNN